MILLDVESKTKQNRNRNRPIVIEATDGCQRKGEVGGWEKNKTTQTFLKRSNTIITLIIDFLAMDEIQKWNDILL